MNMQNNILMTHTFLELWKFQESWNLIGQDKVGHARPEPSRKNKSNGWL